MPISLPFGSRGAADKTATGLPHFSRTWIKPLFRRLNKVEYSPTIAQNTVNPLVVSFLFVNAQGCAATPEKAFETIVPSSRSRLIPRSLEVRCRMNITGSSLISTPKLAPSVIPHCFAPKPCRPFILPRIDTHVIADEATENRGHSTKYEHSPQQHGRDGERCSPSIRGMVSEACTDTMTEASGRTEASSTTTITVNNSSASDGTGRPAGCHNGKLETTGPSSVGHNRDQMQVSMTSSYSKNEFSPLRNRKTHFSGVSPDTGSTLAPWTKNFWSCSPGGCNNQGCESDPSPFQASDNLPPYSKYPERDEDSDFPRKRGGDRKGKEGNDDTWRGEYGSGEKGDGDRDRGSNGDRDGGGNDDNGGGTPRKKISKKTEVACNFCRVRKLKCNGCRPTCHNCARRALICTYEETPRRRGPGRKNRGLLIRESRVRRREREQGSEASTSMPTLVGPSSSASRDVPPLSYHAPTPLPGPPIPQYNFHLGQIHTTPTRLGTGFIPSGGDSSGMGGEHRFQGGQLYSQQQYMRPPQHRDHAQQRRQDQYHLPLAERQPALQHSPHAHLLRGEYSQTPSSASAYSSQMGSIVYPGEPSAGSEPKTLEFPAPEGLSNEGLSHPRSKRRRASSSPEGDAPDGASSSKRKQYDYDRDKDNC